MMTSAVAVKPKKSESTSGFQPISNSSFWTMKNGTRVEIRPISPDDEQCMIKFHKGLSERSVYMRYFESLSLATRTAHTRLARICFADPARETVLVALYRDEKPPFPGEQKILAVGRLSKLSDPNKAEVALLVLDEFQGLGLGSELLRQLVQAARYQSISQIEAEMFRDNTAIQRVCKKLGFRLQLIDPRSVRATLSL